MESIINSLCKSLLFGSFDKKITETLINKTNFKIKTFKKQEIVALEGEHCSSIGIIIKGNIEIKKILESGTSVTLNQLSDGEIFGEVIIFSEKTTYPSTIEANINTSIIFFSKEDILKLCSFNKDFLTKFMGLLSNKILMLNNKIKNMSYSSIRQKLVYYLLEEFKVQGSKKLKLPYSKVKLAEFLAVPRPSLSREFMKLKEEDLIDYDKNYVILKDLNLLEELLY